MRRATWGWVMIVRMRVGILVSILTTAVGLLMAAPASAEIIYQSIPDLTIAQVDNPCSQCGGNGQSVGQQFSLATAATANTVTFVVYSSYVWPTSVTIGIYQDLGGTVGSVVYENTFSSFVSDVPTPNSTDVVTVDVGNVALASGSYLLFMTNPDSLGVATFAAPGNGGFVFVEGSTDPLTGDTYSRALAENTGVSISGVIPEASTWAMMLLGFAGLALAGHGWPRRDRENPAAG